MTLTQPTAVCAACGRAVSSPAVPRFRKDGFEICRCDACGLLFRSVLPTEDELAEIYGPAYFDSAAGDTSGQGYDDYLGDELLHRETARRRLDLLESFTTRGRLLDVGAAAGFFVAEAEARGWDACGIDVSREMVAWGSAHLGLRLSVDSLATVQNDPGSLSALTMWDYIEHAVHPEDELAIGWQLLRSGGVLALSTGDAASVVARLSGRRWHLLTPRHHNYFFTVESLRQLLERLGFRVLFARHLGARYSVRYMTYKLRTMLDAPFVRTAARRVESSGIGGLTVAVNLRDIVTILATKP